MAGQAAHGPGSQRWRAAGAAEYGAAFAVGWRGLEGWQGSGGEVVLAHPEVHGTLPFLPDEAPHPHPPAHSHTCRHAHTGPG